MARTLTLLLLFVLGIIVASAVGGPLVWLAGPQWGWSALVALFLAVSTAIWLGRHYVLPAPVGGPASSAIRVLGLCAVTLGLTTAVGVASQALSGRDVTGLSVWFIVLLLAVQFLHDRAASRGSSLA